MDTHKRVIAHIDMDAYFAAIEQLDNPEYRGKPVIVGGASPRGVVSTASYEARKYGVHSAMPGARAQSLCPNGIFVSGRMQRYQEVSEQIFEVFHDHTPKVEKLSIDEAFLDLTGTISLSGDPIKTAKRIQEDIATRIGITASVGMASNKFLAKLASDMQKPSGFTVIEDERIREILDPLPVRAIWGLGPKSAERLERWRIMTVKDIRTSDESILKDVFGKQWYHYLKLSKGEDSRRVQANTGRKSFGSECTFQNDLLHAEQLETVLLGHVDEVSSRMRRRDLKGSVVSIKIRDKEFRTVTRQCKLAQASNVTRELYNEAKALLAQWRTEHPESYVRLLGFTVSDIKTAAQMGLFTPENNFQQTDDIVDEIRNRFGDGAIQMGRLLKSKTKEDKGELNA